MRSRSDRGDVQRGGYRSMRYTPYTCAERGHRISDVSIGKLKEEYRVLIRYNRERMRFRGGGVVGGVFYSFSAIDPEIAKR